MADNEADALAADITKILDYVEQLNELDTSSVKPTYQLTGLQNVWRKDNVEAGDGSRDDLLALAPDSVDYQVRVPKVL